MSSSKRVAKLGFVLVALAGSIGLAGCTLSPIYSGKVAERASVALAYAKPTSRLEQIIYQDLALRFGGTDSKTAPLVTVSASTSSRGTAMSQTGNPSKPHDVTVTARLTITPQSGEGKAITLTRQATASYTTNSQVLADTEAASEASERAAHAAAESLRLAILAALAR